MDIKNPYRTAEQIGTENSTAHFNFLKSVVFDEGVQAAFSALKPKKFADEFPEERQIVLVLGKHITSFANITSFDSTKIKDNCYVNYFKYTHWLPFPEL
jgi:hypothetical protein